MLKRMLTAVTVLTLAIGVSASAQEKKSEKMEMKEAKAVKMVSCEPECGFMVKSKDEKEVTGIVMEHAKRAHGKSVGEADVKKMMKMDHEMEVKKEVEKKVEKKEVHKH